MYYLPAFVGRRKKTPTGLRMRNPTAACFHTVMSTKFLSIRSQKCFYYASRSHLKFYNRSVVLMFMFLGETSQQEEIVTQLRCQMYTEVD